MPILVMCQDSEKASELRQTHLQAHLHYIETIVPMICVSGPLSQNTQAIEQEQGDSQCYIYDTDDLSIARKLLEHDPYARAGVYSHVAFAKFNPTAGHLIGGVTWK